MPTAGPGLWWNVIADWTDGIGGSDSQTSFGILTPGVPVDLNNIANLIRDDMAGNMWWPAGVTLEEVRIGNGIRAGTGGPASAGAAGTSLPFNSAILVRKLITGLPVKRQGRNFYPGAQPSGVNTSGNLTGGYQSDLQNNFDGLHAAIVGDPDITAIIQFTAPPTSGGSRNYEVVDGFLVTGKVGTLRRRIRR